MLQSILHHNFDILNKLVASGNFYMFAADPETDSLYWSESAAQNLMLTDQNGDALPVSCLIHPDDRDYFLSILNRYPAHWDGIFRIKNKSGLYQNMHIQGNTVEQDGKMYLCGLICPPPADTTVSHDHHLLSRLRYSIEHDFSGFSLTYQPIVYADTGELYGCEALLRWSHSDFPYEIPLNRIIMELEASGLILEVGKWVIQNAFSQCAKWVKSFPEFQMNINVSSIQFEDSDFQHLIMDTLREYKLTPNHITLELTENRQIQDSTRISRIFDFFRSQDIKISFDDFGTGYDTLSIFRVLSADEIKIDRCFLERLTYDITDQKIVKQMIDFCHSINMTICVEGVEQLEQANILKQMGADLCQGFYYSGPLSAESFYQTYLNHAVRKLPPELQNQVSPEVSQSMVYDKVIPAQSLDMEKVTEYAHAAILQVGLDHDFTLISCNEGYRRMVGYTPKEIDEKFKNHALGFVHPEDMEYVNQEIRRQLGLGDTVTIEARIMRSDGSSIWAVGTGNVVRGSNGTSSLIVVILDNDKLKRISLEKEKGYQTLRQITDHLPIGINCIRFDEYFTLDFISPSFLSMLGYTRQDIDEKFDGKYLNMVYEEDRQKLINDMFEQLKISNIVRLRYRSYTKSGKLIWMDMMTSLCEPDGDGIQRCYSSVRNITRLVKDNTQDHDISFANRYQDAVKWWGDILFEYNMTMGTITFSDNYNVLFNRNPNSSFRDELSYLTPAGRREVLTALRSLKRGEHPQPVEIQIRKSQGDYIWCSLVFNQPDYIGGKPVSVLGKITNIDNEKKERDQLWIQSQMDSLTSLYNKGALESHVREELVKSNSAGADRHFAMFMIDIDYFKQVNDSFGHSFGDALLKELAGRMKNYFGSQVIIGRIGGDEFMAFMEYDGNFSNLNAKCDFLHRKLTKEFLYLDYHYTCSISFGVSCYPEDGTLFYDLFRHADSALYHAKFDGKNHYCFFSK